MAQAAGQAQVESEDAGLALYGKHAAMMWMTNMRTSETGLWPRVIKLNTHNEQRCPLATAITMAKWHRCSSCVFKVFTRGHMSVSLVLMLVIHIIAACLPDPTSSDSARAWPPAPCLGNGHRIMGGNGGLGQLGVVA